MHINMFQQAGTNKKLSVLHLVSYRDFTMQLSKKCTAKACWPHINTPAVCFTLHCGHFACTRLVQRSEMDVQQTLAEDSVTQECILCKI